MSILQQHERKLLKHRQSGARVPLQRDEARVMYGRQHLEVGGKGGGEGIRHQCAALLGGGFEPRGGLAQQISVAETTVREIIRCAHTT